MMRISGELRDLAAASALSALLFASGVLVPLLGPPAGFFSAAPLIWLAARHGWSAGLLGGLLATAALLPALPPPVALIFSLEHALPAWFLGSRMRRGKSIVAGSSVAALVVTILMIGAALVLTGGGHDPVQVLEQQLREGLAELGGGGTGPGPGGAPAALNASLEEVLALLRRVLPAVTLIGIFLECSLNSLLAARVLARGAATRATARPDRLPAAGVAGLGAHPGAGAVLGPADPGGDRCAERGAAPALRLPAPGAFDHPAPGGAGAAFAFRQDHVRSRPSSSSPGCSPSRCCSGCSTSASISASAGRSTPPPA